MRDGAALSARTSGLRDEALSRTEAAGYWRCVGHHRRDGEEFAVSRYAQIAHAAGRAPMSARLMRCAEIAPLLVFYACDEVEPAEREAIDAHLAVCALCTAQLDEEREMQ